MKAAFFKIRQQPRTILCRYKHSFHKTPSAHQGEIRLSLLTLKHLPRSSCRLKSSLTAQAAIKTPKSSNNRASKLHLRAASLKIAGVRTHKSQHLITHNTSVTLRKKSPSKLSLSKRSILHIDHRIKTFTRSRSS